MAAPVSTNQPVPLVLADGRRVQAVGYSGLLHKPLLAVFTSSNPVAPPVIEETLAKAVAMASHDFVVIGGFHTPIELALYPRLLGLGIRLVRCPARALPVRLTAEEVQALAQERLLLLSPFPDSTRRASRNTCLRRNRFVLRLATALLAIEPPAESRTARLLTEACALGKPVHIVQPSAA